MLYKAFSLNGMWEMEYAEEKYNETVNPFNTLRITEQNLIENAVPGYWEDMTKAFLYAPFFRRLKINPEYGLQQYPIAVTAPDMALPNIMGTFFYRRKFMWEETKLPVAVHFEGVQNFASVWINDVYLGSHAGYSTPFDISVPEGVLCSGENTIVLSVSNHCLEGYEGEPISGLTTRASNEYTGGITGDVEIRCYESPLRDASVLISQDLKNVEVKLELKEKAVCEWEVYDSANVLKKGTATGDFSFDTENMEYWSPENPRLYSLKVICKDAYLTLKFGVRRLVADGVHFKLNNTPYFLRGVCEHFYIPETIHPAHDINYYRSMIKQFKTLGFNFIRFHTYIPEEEFMQAADELGILLHVESPNNTTYDEWKKIVSFCRHHTSVVIYCCGNELMIDEPFIEHLSDCAHYVHENTDSLFSPVSALRGLEYVLAPPAEEGEVKSKPFIHHAGRFETVGKFCDMYSSYTNGHHSYTSLDCDSAEIDRWSCVYNKPRVSHEICIDGTYTDLSLKGRYEGTRVGKTDMFDSIERHLKDKGVLHKAPLYFKNSSEWQRRVRKYCFEALRMSDNMAGYDFLGPIDTHWHTFGYDVGMMNEFYELKPGETVRNVLMYNSESVLLTDLGRKTNFYAGENLSCGIYVSYYGAKALKNARLDIRLMEAGKVVLRETKQIEEGIVNGKVSKLCDLNMPLPQTDKPCEFSLYVTLDGEECFVENMWEVYVFPKQENKQPENAVVSQGMSKEELEKALTEGKNVLIIGSKPFESLPTTFRISLAGRTSGNLATVVNDHPVLANMPHSGFCGWQFSEMMENGNAVCFENDLVPFNPIIEVVSTHKYVIRQSALFEFNAFNGKLLVCSFDFKENDPASQWFASQIIAYADSNEFNPSDTLSAEQFKALVEGKVKKAEANTNFALNLNDKTANRKKK